MKTSYHFLPDLNQEVASSLAAAPPQPSIQGRAIYADSNVRILLLPFRAGQTLAEHTSPYAATMHVLKGNGEITLGQDRKTVHAGSWIRMEPGLPHSIHAETDLVLMLQVFLDDRQSDNPTIRQSDSPTV